MMYTIIKKNDEYGVYELDDCGQIYAGPIVLHTYSKHELITLLEQIFNDLSIDNDVKELYNMEETEETQYELDPYTPIDEAFR